MCDHYQFNLSIMCSGYTQERVSHEISLASRLRKEPFIRMINAAPAWVSCAVYSSGIVPHGKWLTSNQRRFIKLGLEVSLGRGLQQPRKISQLGIRVLVWAMGTIMKQYRLQISSMLMVIGYSLQDQVKDHSHSPTYSFP